MQKNSEPFPPQPPHCFQLHTSGWSRVKAWSRLLNPSAPVNPSCANGLCADAKTCGPVSEAINHQQLTWTHYVTRCLRPFWFGSGSTVQRTCSCVSHAVLSGHRVTCGDVCYRLWFPWDDDITLSLCLDWFWLCQFLTWLYLQPIFSPSPFPVFTHLSMFWNVQANASFIWENTPSSVLSCPRPTALTREHYLASQAIYSISCFILVCCVWLYVITLLLTYRHAKLSLSATLSVELFT